MNTRVNLLRSTIKNWSELLDSSKTCSLCLKARKTILELLEEGLKAADPYHAVRKHISRVDGKIVVNGEAFTPEKIYLIALGKASVPMTLAVEEVLGDLIVEGVVSAPKYSRGVFNKLPSKSKVLWAGHPIPDQDSVRAGEKALEIALKAGERDLVIVLVSGGGSALMERPADEISLNELIETTKLLLKSGATIDEINTVRKHLSWFKGGWLAKKAYPANLVALIISDVVGDPLETIASGPTAPDPTTFNDAYNVLRYYGIWDRLLEKPREYIEKGLRGEVPETPKPGDKVFSRVYNKIVASNIVSLKAMEKKAKEKGYNTIILTSRIQGEARHVGRVLAGIALEVHYNGYPVKPPAVILSGGETTVTVVGDGRGGRNQELVLSASLDIAGHHGIALASIGTDGVDGVTDAAGAIADAHTLERSRSKKLSPYDILARNDSYTFFKKLGDLIITGPTGTNVNDIQIIVVEASGKAKL